MICCNRIMEPCRHRPTRKKAHLCGRCGRLVRLDYNTGRLIVIWPPRVRDNVKGGAS